MPMYNFIEYSDNYQDSPAALYQYKRDEPPADIANNLATNISSSFKYKVDLLGNPAVVNNVARRNVKVVVPLKYLSNFFRSLEIPLINCKIKLNLTWKEKCYYQLTPMMLLILEIMQYLLLMMQIIRSSCYCVKRR